MTTFLASTSINGWYEAQGLKVVFWSIAGINLAVCSLTITMYIFGRKFRALVSNSTLLNIPHLIADADCSQGWLQDFAMSSRGSTQSGMGSISGRIDIRFILSLFVYQAHPSVLQSFCLFSFVYPREKEYLKKRSRLCGSAKCEGSNFTIQVPSPSLRVRMSLEMSVLYGF